MLRFLLPSSCPRSCLHLHSASRTPCKHHDSQAKVTCNSEVHPFAQIHTLLLNLSLLTGKHHGPHSILSHKSFKMRSNFFTLTGRYHGPFQPTPDDSARGSQRHLSRHVLSGVLSLNINKIDLCLLLCVCLNRSRKKCLLVTGWAFHEVAHAAFAEHRHIHSHAHSSHKDNNCALHHTHNTIVCSPQVTMLLLGGFSIAAALSKHFIAKQMAVAVLSRVGRVPRNVLLASMFVSRKKSSDCFMHKYGCMWQCCHA